MTKQTLLKIIFYLLFLPALLAGTAALFGAENYAALSLVLVLGGMIPFFVRFEKKPMSSTVLVIFSAMTAFSAAGRFIFSFFPGFKPVTAMVVITGMYLGSEYGFMCGALSAFVTDFYFGQGPWTPFQMISWGIIGFTAGIIAPLIKKSRIAITVFAFFSGAAFSLIMDIWTALWAGGSFEFSRYLALIVTALPVTAEYIISDAVFLNLLARSMGKKISRVLTKYSPPEKSDEI